MKQNTLNPYCARCSSRLKRNGTKNGKTRFRCSRCGYNETENSIAHNSNKRVFPIGYTQLKKRSMLVQRSNFVALNASNSTARKHTVTDLTQVTPNRFRLGTLKDSEKNPNTTLDRETVNHTKLDP